MQIRLNDEEIRKALATAMASKANHCVEVNPEVCWFECIAEDIDSAGNVGGIEEITFVFDTTQE